MEGDGSIVIVLAAFVKSEGQLGPKKTKYNLVVEEDDKRMDQIGSVCEPGEGTERGQR